MYQVSLDKSRNREQPAYYFFKEKGQKLLIFFTAFKSTDFWFRLEKRFLFAALNFNLPENAFKIQCLVNFETFESSERSEKKGGKNLTGKNISKLVV